MVHFVKKGRIDRRSGVRVSVQQEWQYPLGSVPVRRSHIFRGACPECGGKLGVHKICLSCGYNARKESEDS